ncbi:MULTISPECIES: MaoC family dehydratase [unclassified Sphingomonas]|uniref:MaoC family dehydratase n=1 Tax=unclassified Sphingomonas TaxID=196159 RepID=UPI0006FB34A4|nr:MULTISPECIES: MaoC family dehydratase [unclassified Sphingomonas]KQX17627.1 dehydratase [Sphingomonas sp. Root1294]KQY70553.1 dehydratase [Sphingomonas sp. Root50]KRB91960.1 dehydratase [Sphingomonas sp. Root720]
MSRLVVATPAGLLGREGEKFGPSDWLVIDQARVDRFAEATGDHQWIHVDPVRAADGPFGGTIAHGYLTMSLVNLFLPDLIEVRGVAMGVNVGADRLRFLNPVKVSKRVRGSAEIVGVEEIKGAIQSTVRVTVEIEGETKPACVIDTISRYYPESSPHA